MGRFVEEVLQTLFPELEKSGAIYYTRELFLRYRESLKRCVRVKILDRLDREDSCMYISRSIEGQRGNGMSFTTLVPEPSNAAACAWSRLGFHAFISSRCLSGWMWM
ncbi:hypothetical protein PIB30_054516 [Stylosanthes scabra]|uniref:Uncharacterized protein n=1 Tax=Stylosanthes scabra TaxID=79078 RepID=A0ABU6UKU1_9FABA|nr:hypothetical protein [Stylosanthes scabra]